MHWGKRRPDSPSKRRRSAFFRPDAESLEGRRLLATIDLSTTQTQPQGVEFVGKAAGNMDGYTVTDVGNVTGSGYDSFVIATTGLAPLTTPSGTLRDLTKAGESAAYLVLGSKQVNISNAVDYLGLASGTISTTGTTAQGLVGSRRAGDLGELGTLGVKTQNDVMNSLTSQTNPTVAQPQPMLDSTHQFGFNFDGLTLVTGLDATTGLGRNSGLGFSVAALGDLNSDGFDDFAISAPNDAGGGKVFVVFGGSALKNQAIGSKTIDLEPTAGTDSTTTPTKVVSFTLGTGTTGTDVGYSVAGIGNYFNTTNAHDLAIGVPGMSVTTGTTTNANAGAVFTLEGAYVTGLSTGTNIDLASIGNGTIRTAGIEYTGTAANALTGFSVGTPGNFDGQVGSGHAIDDLLIGAPGAGGGGQAYLVYSRQTYIPNPDDRDDPAPDDPGCGTDHQSSYVPASGDCLRRDDG